MSAAVPTNRQTAGPPAPSDRAILRKRRDRLREAVAELSTAIWDRRAILERPELAPPAVRELGEYVDDVLDRLESLALAAGFTREAKPPAPISPRED